MMLKRSFALICSLALLLGLFSACGKKDDGRAAALVYPIAEQARSLDPQLAQTAAENITANCFEGLVISYEQGQYLPGVAESWDVSDDGLVYTFNLYKDAKWHKPTSFEKTFGKEVVDKFPDLVTAHDFVFAFRRALDPKTGSPYAANLFALRNADKVNKSRAPLTDLAVEAMDDFRLKITLSHRQDDFLKTLTDPICMPCNQTFFEATGGRYGLGDDYLMCNGPFYLSIWTQDSSILLRKNKDYRQADQVYPNSVSLRINPDTDQYAQRVAQGVYSAAPLPQADKSYAQDADLNLLPFENEVGVIALNCSDPGLKNQNLRLALLEVLDHDSLEGLRDGGPKTDTFIPPCCLRGEFESLLDNKGLKSFTFNEAAAPARFDKALIELGIDSVTLEFLCPSEFERPVREVLQVWQKAFGVQISAHVVPLTLPELNERVKSGDFQIALTRVKAEKSSPGDFLQGFTSDSPSNFIAYKDSLYDITLEASRLSKDKGALDDQYISAHNLLLQSAALLPLNVHTNYLALARGVEGLGYSSAGDRIYFAHALKKDK